MPCRGTGQVISNLGGAQSRVRCPWCRGGGLRLREVNAQEHGPAAGAGEDAVSVETEDGVSAEPEGDVNDGTGERGDGEADARSGVV